MRALFLLLIHLSVFTNCDVSKLEELPTADPLQVKIGGRSKLFVGQRSNFNCSIEGGIAPFEISFHEAGQNISNLNTISVTAKEHDTTLVLLCSVTDSSGATDQDYKIITVLAAPLQVEIEGHPNILPGQSANFNCSIEGGEPPFEISFQEAGKDIVNLSTISVTAKNNQEDLILLCSVKDSLGATDKAYKTITVIEYPNVQTANFTCYADLKGGNSSSEISFNEAGLNITNQETIFITAKILNETINVLYNVRDKTITDLVADEIAGDVGFARGFDVHVGTINFFGNAWNVPESSGCCEACGKSWPKTQLYVYSIDMKFCICAEHKKEAGYVKTKPAGNTTFSGNCAAPSEARVVKMSNLRCNIEGGDAPFEIFFNEGGVEVINQDTISVSVSAMKNTFLLYNVNDKTITMSDAVIQHEHMESFLVIPTLPKDKLMASSTSIIMYNKQQIRDRKGVEGWLAWQNRTNIFLEKHQEPIKKYKHCQDLQVEDCVMAFDKNKLEECGEGNFGYDEGRPCVLLQLNKVLGLEYEYYEGGPFPDDFPQELAKHVKMQQNKKQVWVDCKGVNTVDQDMMGPLDYYPSSRGFSSSYFPYFDEIGYQSPLLAIKFLRPSIGMMLDIECRAWAKNISVGKARFQLIIYNQRYNPSSKGIQKDGYKYI